MFDFFRYMAQELNGIDVKTVNKIEAEKKAIDKSNRFIFSKRMKIVVIILGIIYFLISLNMLFVSSSIEGNIFYIVKYAILMILDIVACGFLIFSGKQGEIIALVCIFLFVATMYLSLVVYI